MNILIPYNTHYLRAQYNLDGAILNQLNTDVIPSLVNRLCVDERIVKLDVMTNIDISGKLSPSSKVEILDLDTAKLETRVQVIDSYLQNTKLGDEEFLIVYNPLFPFISISKLQGAHQAVVNGASQTAVGSFINGSFETRSAAEQYLDIGAFSVHKISTVKSVGHHLSYPLDIFRLSASESVCLRDAQDLELYGLIKNSGFLS